MSVYYFMFEAKPLKESPDYKDCGGAFINCWVNSETETNALEKVKTYIKEEKWEINKIKEKFIATRERYEEDIEVLECFDQAVNEGISSIFYVWPTDAKDAYIDNP